MRKELLRSFRVTIDGEKQIVAGSQDGALLSVILSQMKDGSQSLHIGGLTDLDSDGIAYQVRWGAHDLHVTHSLLVEVLDTDQTDDPVRRYRSDVDVQESPYSEEEWREMEYQDYLRLKEIFEAPNLKPQPKP